MFVGDLDEENEQSDAGDEEDLKGKLGEEIDDDLETYDKKTNSTANTANKKKGMLGKKRNNKKINLEYEYENEDLSSNKKNTNKNKSRSQGHNNNFDFWREEVMF